MKIKTLFIVFFVLLSFACSLQVQGQRRKNDILTDYTKVKDSMSVYNFRDAIDILEEDIAKRTKRRKPTEEAENLLSIAHRNLGKLMATERVVFIDSIIVNKQDAIKHIHLSSESGSLQSMSELQNKPDTMDCTMFCNQLGNYALFTQKGPNGKLGIYQSELIGGEWTPYSQLKGLNDIDSPADLNYPFMLTDGATMYYAAKDEESLGGYDIYMTRYDADSQEFLAPENIGMPFNSPANDYLFAIDEFYNLGWFVTDRNMPEGKVCVYTFIPNETRKIYNEEEIGMQKLRRMARINSIKETWTNQAQVSEAKERLEALLSAKENSETNKQFTFVLNDHKTYHLENDFQNEEARNLIKIWMNQSKELNNARIQLENLREKYASVDDAQKSQMAPQIRLIENTYESLMEEVKQLEINIRSIEMEK